MENRTFYNEILTDHNLHPFHKTKLDNPDLILEGVNPSCGDDIVLELKVEDGVITDGAFAGSGCAISQASVDIMLDMIIGRKKEEALHDSRRSRGKRDRRTRRGGGSSRYCTYASEGKMCFIGLENPKGNDYCLIH